MDRKNSRLVYSTGGEAPEPEPAETGTRSPKAGSGSVRVRLERRASDRVVTVVSGLRGDAAGIRALARELKTACAAGGTLKSGVLEIQGDHSEAVRSFLSERGFAPKA